MKMKMILPMMLIAALPLGADAQNKSGLVMSNLDQTVKASRQFLSVCYRWMAEEQSSSCRLQPLWQF